MKIRKITEEFSRDKRQFTSKDIGKRIRLVCSEGFSLDDGNVWADLKHNKLFI